MTGQMFGKQGAAWLAAAVMTIGVGLPGAEAKTSSTLPQKVANAPVCDYTARPKITKVAPDPVKAGDKIVIKGENFGSRECFHTVSFGSLSASTVKYLNTTTVEATVPNVKPGLTPVHVLTEGGSTQFVVLVTK